VGITGSNRCLRYFKYLTPVVIGAFLLTTGAASAHTLSDQRKERFHIARRGLKELGVPYQWGGSTPNGFDCSGFTRWTFLEHGSDLPHSAAMQFELGSHGDYKRIWRRSRLKVGDLVFFSSSSSHVGHTGIYTGHGQFVSATTSSGVHVDSVHDRYYWGSRWVGATRIPAMRYLKTTTKGTTTSVESDPLLPPGKGHRIEDVKNGPS
jgi:hypothetical protein